MNRASTSATRANRYPEVGAGGFSRVDGTVEFYTRVNSLLSPTSTVVDFGAGRGRQREDPVDYRRDLQVLRGKVERVVGLDVSDAVLSNQAVDESHIIEDGCRLPINDESVDLVVSDYTFEHVLDGEWLSGELDRIVRPGGWICARTPNKWGLIAAGARLVPNALHTSALRVLQPSKHAVDTFPTAYQMNTRASLRRLFPVERFQDCSYLHESEPAYVGTSSLGWRAMSMAATWTPTPLKTMWFVFLQKRG